MRPPLHPVDVRPEPSPPARTHRAEEAHALADRLGKIVQARWTILGALAVALACGVLYLLVATPKYRVDTVVQVENTNKGFLGQLEQIPGYPETMNPADTEIRILRSRSLLIPVIQELRLDVVAKARSIPVLGRLVARWRDAAEPAPAVLGLSSFAWGGERIEITRLQVPRALESKPLDLVVLAPGQYELRGPEGRPLLRGEVGTAAVSAPDPRSGDKVEIFVADLAGRPGLRFSVSKLSLELVLKGLQDRLTIAEQGKKTGIIEIASTGPDATREAALVDAIARTYVRMNVEHKSAEAERTLEFINSQLPLLKANLDRAEAELGQFRSKSSAVDLSMKTKAILDRATLVEQRASELALQRAELRQKFTENHPAVTALKQKEANLRAEQANVEAELGQLPKAEVTSVRLMRDVKVANEMYVLLLNKAQELKVVKSGTIGNVRILDPALVPDEPASPKALIVIASCLLVGLGLGFSSTLLRNALDMTVDDPAEIERETGLPVYASIPHSDAQAATGRRRARRPIPLLAATNGTDLAVEGLRSLRTTLLFAMAETRQNVVAVNGPSPEIGKSFVCANLAYVLAETGKKVVVVDADIRRGRLHLYFGLAKNPGLADVITGVATPEDAVRPTASPNLHVVTMGDPPPNPAELLSSGRFQNFVGTLSARFDVVLIDTAPILAVTDAALVGRAARLNLLVLRAGHHSLHEIVAAVKRFEQNGVETRAIVLNDVPPKPVAYGTSRYGYNYSYEYKA